MDAPADRPAGIHCFGDYGRLAMIALASAIEFGPVVGLLTLMA
jgi:hypothetical protein